MPRFLYSVLSPLPFQLWPIKLERDHIGQTSVKNSIPSYVEDWNINNYIIMNHACDYYRFRPQCMCCTIRVKQFQSQRRARIACCCWCWLVRVGWCTNLGCLRALPQKLCSKCPACERAAHLLKYSPPKNLV